jgi:hypothetical protein
MKNLYTVISALMKCLCLGMLVIGMLLIPPAAEAQNYYPAGLGNANLQLWLTAADPTTILTSSGTPASNGKSVATWNDKSGHGANAVQATAGDQPVYQTNQLNGLGGIIFQNTGQYMTGPSGAYQTVISTRAMLGTSYQYLFSSPALTDFSVRYHGGTTSVQYTDGPNVNDWDYNTGATPTQWINGVQSLSGSTTTHILVDEAQAATNSTYSLSSTFMSRGMYNNDPVYDLLVYNNTPNTTQRKLLESYEAVQWGLTGDLPTTGYPVFTPPTPSTYNKNLVGIGYTSSTDNFLTDVAGSTDGLGFSSGTTAADFLENAGFVMAAHNGQTNSVTYNPTLNHVPVNSYVWNRSWYVQLSGGNNSGNVTLNFNFSDYNGTTPNAGYYFALLYNPSNGSFGSGTNTQVSNVSYSVSGNTVSFVVKAANLATGYYTIVYNQNNVLPITLESFSVSKLSADAALAKWTVGGDFGSGTFSVGRSADGTQFSTIGTVEADANAVGSGTYSFVDNSPLQGMSYYRLEMTNNTGEVSYSAVVPVEFGSTSRSITLYPVPATDMLHISAPGVSGGGTAELFSVAGQLLANYQLSTLDGASLPVSGLVPGAYFVRIRAGVQAIALSFVKR